MPSTGYEINTDKTYCYIDNENDQIKNKIHTNENGEIVISGLSKRSKCVLYFDKKSPTLKEYVLAHNQGTTNNFDGTSCIDESCDYQENGIYEAEDENGTTSYYFRGTVENNYVKFGRTNSERWTEEVNTGSMYEEGIGSYSTQQECESNKKYSGTCTKLYGTNEDIWWRIIRINGDGSIRMIYAGTSSNGNVPSQIGYEVSIGAFRFDNGWGSEYVGYQYTLGERNGHTSDSNAKTEIENWFKENLLDEYNVGYIDKNAGFCGDRSVTSGTGIGENDSDYGPYERVFHTYVPTFLCEDKEYDLYTVQGASEGTRSLEYPVGLITADEVVYAGRPSENGSTNNYLHNNRNYWTMSPSQSNFCEDCNGGEVITAPLDRGGIDGGLIWADFIVRPVINLVAGSLTKGDGTVSNPYQVS